jgi:hypothetical protein
LEALRPGSGGFVYVVEDLRNHEKLVLKSSFVHQSKRDEFEKVNGVWKMLSNSCEFIVKFKDFFYEGPNACLNF